MRANAFGDGKPIAKSPATEFLALVSPEAHEKAPPPSWRDVYVGLNGGGAWSNPYSTFATAPISAAPASGPVAAASVIQDRNNRLAGFVGGLQLGANWRFDNNIVAGAEADLHGAAGNTDTAQQTNFVTAGGNTFLNYGLHRTTLNYLGTIRGRLGYLVTPTLQLYGTGGMAYGGVTANTAQSTQRIGGASITSANLLYRDSLVGWSAGGGVEWAFMPNWSVKAEYLHYNLGAVTTTGFAIQPNGFFSYAASARTRFDGNLIQAGVNRHFDLLAAASEKKE